MANQTLSFKVDARSFANVAKKINALASLPDRTKAMRASAEILLEEARANMSLRDHSLDDLAELDHPYARRHGAIGIHGGDERLVHEQGGKLVKALDLRERSGEGRATVPYVVIDRRKAKHATYVIEGTSKMLPRDSLWLTGEDKATQKRMMRAAELAVTADLKKVAK